MRSAAFGAGAIAMAVVLASACSSYEAADAQRHPLCVDGTSADGVYPKATPKAALRATLPDLELDASDDAGQPSKVALHDYFEPCAAKSRLLVIRVSGAWCGTCRWHASHTKELLALDVGPRLELLDVLVADDDNASAKVANLAAWRARIDAPQKLAIDPARRLLPITPAAAPLPLFVIVDTKTMVAVDALNDPAPDLLEQRLREAIAELDGDAKPAPRPVTLMDGRFTRNQWDLIREMTLPGAPPPDPTNTKADDPLAAALGKKLFSDPALGPSAKVSCASCHDASKQLNDQLPRSTGGASPVDRNSPAIALAAHARWQFWDGRADTLWVQALGPLENEKEFNSTRLFVDHVVSTKYRAEYEAVWGAMPDLTSTTRFPTNGKPGSPEWATMTRDDQQAASRVFVNVGKSMAAFERTLRVEPNALDRYVAGDLAALSASEKDGLGAFFAGGCAQCHYGPRLTDDAFHILRFPSGRVDGRPDRGRIDGVALLQSAELTSASEWSDAPDPARIRSLVPDSTALGAFKTPTLRGLAGSAPYGHGGSFATVNEAVKAHAGVDPSNMLVAGALEPWVPRLDDAAAAPIPVFLAAVSATPVIP